VGPSNLVRVRIDLDSPDQQFALVDVGLGNCPEPQARLHVAGHNGAAFRFVTPNAEGSQVTVRAKDTARLEIERSVLDTAGAEGVDTVTLSGQITRRLADRDSPPAPLEIVVDLFRSGPPTPKFIFVPVEALDALSTVPVDDHVAIGRIEVSVDRQGVFSTGIARLEVIPTLTLTGQETCTPSLLVRRPRQDNDDPAWHETGLPFTDELRLDPNEERFDLDSIDIGLAYSAFSTWLRRSAARPRSRQQIKLHVAVRVLTAGEPSTPLLEREFVHTIDVSGSLPETITLSGHGPPMVLPLKLGGGAPPRYSLPSLSVKPAADGRSLHAPSPHLDIIYDGLGISEVAVGYRLHAGGSDLMSGQADAVELESGQAAGARLDIAEWLGGVDRRLLSGDIVCVVSVTVMRREAGRPASTNQFEFEIAIRFAPDRPDWMACVDFGTSSTAIWIGRNDADRDGLLLRLGQWLERIDPFHEESVWWRSADAEPSNRISYLIPSHIGLAPKINLRADYDPLSLGDLALSAPGESATMQRLKRLNRSYDVSFPFPSRSLMAEHIDTIVTEPKRRMIGRADHVRLTEDVLVREPGKDGVVPTRRVDLARLIEDCFAELGGYVAHCALELDLDQPAGRSARPAPFDHRRAALAGRLEQARMSERFSLGLVITHPSGIDRKRTAIYRKAGQRFLQEFSRVSVHETGGDVRLVGEALAAARFGVDHYARNTRISPEGEKRSFITLDIGAGTYDVTVIDTMLNQRGPTKWDVRSHFGLTIGGNDLDRALAEQVTQILRIAANTPEIARSFDFETELPYSTADMWSMSQQQRQTSLHFLTELHAAKARLTERLLNIPDGEFDWLPQAAGRLAFEMRIGLAGDETWPVRFKSSSANTSAALTLSIPGVDAEIGTQRDATGISICLRLWRGAFTPGEADDRGQLAPVLKLMGVELPRLAWLEYLRKCEGPHTGGGLPPTWIVTGRAALWPPLFSAIRKTIAELGPDAGALVQPRPFSPDNMKRAVVAGAVQLAGEPWTISDEGVYNPIALITYRTSSDLSGGATRSIADIIRVVDDDSSAPAPRVVETRETFSIARILPGLDAEEGRSARIELFNQLGLRPWDELEREVPLPKQAGSEVVRWTISARRDLSGLHLSFDPGPENGQPLTFGPFKEGRVYDSN
jgi:hypothetical protein